mgnify:CR=1 FL=1
MATFVIDTLTNAQTTLAANDEYFILEGVTQYFTSAVIDVTGNNTDIFILGAIVTTAFNTIELGANTDTNIYVGPTGSILTSSSFRSIKGTGSGTTVTNYGTISGGQIELDGDTTIFVNGGTVDGTYPSGGLIAALRMNGQDSRLVNSGMMNAASDFIVRVEGTATVVNSGTMTGANDGIRAVLSLGEVFRLSNSGTIAADGLAVLAGADSDVISNTGTITGDIQMGGGADAYMGLGAGVTAGTVLGENGNDTLTGGDFADDFDGGADDDQLVGRGGDDVLDGGSGDDFILGGEGNDDINGGSNNDTLNANAGDDTVYGEGGNDVLVGQDGSDLLDGGDNDDILDGGNGDDTLEGGSGNDILRGRAGEDDLAGGLGLDYLTGGEGADNFVFRSIGDAGIGATRDQILDFEQGVDTIIIAGLSPGVFEFRGTAAFAPSGNPEIRLNETATGSTIVQIDNNGDGTIDAEIRVGGVTGLTADDFVL